MSQKTLGYLFIVCLYSIVSSVHLKVFMKVQRGAMHFCICEHAYCATEEAMQF